MAHRAFEPESHARRLVVAGGLAALAVSVAPRLLAQQPGARAVPSVGDTWRYQYRSEWRTVAPQTIDYVVEEVSPQGIRDRMTVVGLPGADVRTFTSRIEEVNRAVPGFVANEFSPYLQAFMAVLPGARLAAPAMPPDSMFGLPWSVLVRVGEQERVTVPAGTFETWRIDLTGGRSPYRLTVAEPASLYERVWFAPGPKRVVKHHRITEAPGDSPLQRDTYELVSYKVA